MYDQRTGMCVRKMQRKRQTFAKKERLITSTYARTRSSCRFHLYHHKVEKRKMPRVQVQGLQHIGESTGKREKRETKLFLKWLKAVGRGPDIGPGTP